MISMEELDEYPCLSFDQGKNNSLYLAEEMKSTYDYRRLIKANDRGHASEPNERPECLHPVFRHHLQGLERG